MRLKSFYAKTMTEAMQMVRDTLGEDAVIVASREEKGGKAVHVTAAIEPLHEQADDPGFEPGTGGMDIQEGWLQYDSEDEESAVAEEITDAMLRHAVPEEVMDHIISCATVIGMENPGTALIAAIEHLFSFQKIPAKPLKRAMMVVGPPGSGKTLAAAKLATRAVMNGLKVGIITTDTVRAGGIEQLEAFTKLLRVELQKCTNAKSLQKTVQNLKACDQIIIDTQGINPFNPNEMREIAQIIEYIPVDPLLVLPAGSDAEESGEIARAFSSINVKHLMPSRIDIARRMGSLLSAAHYGHMIFSEASNTPKVADGLTPLSPEKLSRILMPHAYRKKDPLDSSSGKRDSLKTGTRQ